MKTLDGSKRSDWNHGLDKWIIDTLTKYKYVNIDFIRNTINKERGERIGWITLKRHIDYLLERNKIILREQFKFDTKTTRIYGIQNLEIYDDDDEIIKKEILLLKTKIRKLQKKLNIKKTTNRKPISNKIRFKIFRRDNFTCQYCGKNPKNDKNIILEVDHKIPIKSGGKDDIENLVTSCRECNTGKKDT